MPVERSEFEKLPGLVEGMLDDPKIHETTRSICTRIIKGIRDVREQQWSIPYFKELMAGTLPLECLGGFVRMYYKVGASVNSCLAIQYSRLLPIAKRADIVDEMLAENVGGEIGYPTPGGHARMILKTAKKLGIPYDELVDIEPVLGMRRFYNLGAKWAMVLGLGERAVAGITGEGNLRDISELHLISLTRHYGFTDDDCEFFKVHGIADIEHVKEGVHWLDWCVRNGQVSLDPSYPWERLGMSSVFAVKYYDEIYKMYHPKFKGA